MTVALDLSRESILAHRRAVNGLDARGLADPAPRTCATRAGLQDSMPRAALLSLHARLQGVGPDALDDPSLIQIWGPRFSCYVVEAEDRAVFTLGRLPAEARGRERAERIAAGLARLLGGGVSDDRLIASELGIHPSALKYATATGTVQIRWTGARAPDMWIVPAPEVDPDTARCELARRHLHVFGPATAERFAEWAGISRRSAQATYRSLAPQLVAVRTPIGDAWILAADEAGFQAGEPAAQAGSQTDAPCVRLLPSGDSYVLCQGVERALLLPDAACQAQLWPSRVWPGALVIGGEIRGVWRRAGPEVVLEVSGPLSDAEREVVEAEVAGLPLPGLPRTPYAVWRD
jgi:hypothetical protein